MILSETGPENLAEELIQSVQTELDEADRSLREVNLMLEQSQQELSKLTQRNGAINVHLQQVQKQMDTLPLDEVRNAYESAIDAQQRLFVMRGQLEKLQSDRTHLERYRTSLKRTQDLLSQGIGTGPRGGKATVTGMEMIIDAQEVERQRLSRQMHDGPAQALSNFILQTEIAMRLIDVDPAQARNELASLKATAMATFQKVRNFIFELRPMMLDDLGLIPTIKRYSETFKEQSGIDVNLTISGPERRLEPYIEVMIFRALQELLGNAARHSQATLIKIHADMGEAAVKVHVEDNGKGFDTGVLKQSNSLGLKLIQDRVEMLGGTCDISSMPASGTSVTFIVPARSPAA
jgi:two-component system, NarL family, sensor histidine kinase DegS